MYKCILIKLKLLGIMLQYYEFCYEQMMRSSFALSFVHPLHSNPHSASTFSTNCTGVGSNSLSYPGSNKNRANILSAYYELNTALSG